MGCTQSRHGSELASRIDDAKWPAGVVKRSSSLTFHRFKGRALNVELQVSVAQTELTIRTQYQICGLTTSISDGNGKAVLTCTDQRTLMRAREGGVLYQRIRLLPRPFCEEKMQKWRRIGGAGNSLPPVVTVIDWGGGGFVDPPDRREIHAIKGDLNKPAEAVGRENDVLARIKFPARPNVSKEPQAFELSLNIALPEAKAKGRGLFGQRAEQAAGDAHPRAEETLMLLVCFATSMLWAYQDSWGPPDEHHDDYVYYP
mmetsp:Transcript_8744/g.17597  ORF Transcript_8744/g.17597 Transcript_8744/m.17597 type:complete len:258 (+) Transcript_8744:90-863(+)